MKNRFPKRILAMILTLLMVLSILPTVFAENTTPFTDVEPDRWYTDAVNYVYEKGLMNGTSPTTFSPNLTANRAMVVTILYRNDGSPHVEFVPKFNDVEENRWYTDGVMWAVENEITKGTGAATFSPNRDITREELAVFLYRYAVYKGFDVSASADLSVYPDADQVHSWAEKEMQWAVGSEIIHGAGKPAQLLPRKTATRAELATMIQRFLLAQSLEGEDIIIGGLDANVWTTKYGNIYTSCTAARLQEMGFAYGDIVTVKFLDKVLDLPLVPTFSYVDQGTPGLFINKSETGGFDGYLFMAINMGNFTTTYGIATKTTNEDGTWYWTACEGVEFPIVVTLEMKEQGGYLDEMLLHDINRTNNREDYPDLTDEEFANFRQITTTGMGDHLYRGSSPINPEIGRNTYADAAIENAGVTVIMNLANNQADAEAYAGYTETYYSKQNVIFLNLGVDFQAEDFQAGLANGLRHFAENKGVYYVHCTEGKDRAGFVSALLECLMGATYDEVVADYLKTYTNYYTVVDGVHQALSQETLDAIADSNIIKTLKTAFDVEDLTTANLADEAAAYIREIGLTDEQIAALKENLAGTGEEPTVSYEVADTVAAGDQIIMVYTVNDKYYAMSSDVSDYGIMTPVEVTFTDGALTAPDSSTVFTLAAGSEEGSYQLQTADGKALNYSGSGTGISLQDAGSDWTLTLGAGTSKVKAANATNRYLFVQNYQDALRIKCYTESNMTGSNYYATATLYKVVTAG